RATRVTFSRIQVRKEREGGAAMAESRRCPQCGMELPADAPEGLCPKCVLALGMNASSAAQGEKMPPTSPYRPESKFVPPEPAELAKLFPQLETLELLDQGGMGAVYK